jgi:hypothetical protein
MQTQRQPRVFHINLSPSYMIERSHEAPPSKRWWKLIQCRTRLSPLPPESSAAPTRWISRAATPPALVSTTHSPNSAEDVPALRALRGLFMQRHIMKGYVSIVVFAPHVPRFCPSASYLAPSADLFHYSRTSEQGASQKASLPINTPCGPGPRLAHQRTRCTRRPRATAFFCTRPNFDRNSDDAPIGSPPNSRITLEHTPPGRKPQLSGHTA